MKLSWGGGNIGLERVLSYTVLPNVILTVRTEWECTAPAKDIRTRRCCVCVCWCHLFTPPSSKSLSSSFSSDNFFWNFLHYTDTDANKPCVIVFISTKAFFITLSVHDFQPPPPSRFVSSPPARVVTSPSLGCVNTEALMIEHIPITHDQPMTVTGTIVSPIHASVMITVTDVIAPARALALSPRLHKHLSLTCRGAADAHSSMSGARDYTGNEVYASIIILVIRQHLLADGVTQRRTVSLHSQAEKSVGVHPVEVPASKTRNQHQVIFTDVAVLAPSSLNFSPPQSRIPWKKARQLYILTSVGI